MFTCPIQLTDVIYNAADQSFEASVTLYDAGIERRYACAINAPISMSFEDAARGLKATALRHHAKNVGLHSVAHAVKQNTRMPAPRFDLTRWLQGLLSGTGQRTA